jgi:hypothetical protein
MRRTKRDTLGGMAISLRARYKPGDAAKCRDNAIFLSRSGTDAPAQVFGSRSRTTLTWRINMPPRDTELPEGTDQIIDGALETNASGTTTGTGSGGGGGSGFIGSGADLSTSAGGTATGKGSKVIDQLKTEAASLRGQATTRVRDFAEGGKARASDALDELSRVVDEAAGSIEERLGGEYGGYARRASGAVSDFAATLRNKDVDELYDGARSAVRKSPVIAIAAAAVVGFALVRLVKAGLPDKDADAQAGGSRGGGRSEA